MAFSWKHNGKTIITSQNIQILQDGRILSLSPVIAASEGEYECGAQENHIVWMNTHTVTVAKQMSYTLKIHEGSEVNLLCLRPPHIKYSAYAQWHKDTNDGNRTVLRPKGGITEGMDEGMAGDVGETVARGMNESITEGGAEAVAEDIAEGDVNRVEWLFARPEDRDQTISIQGLLIGDSGTYYCVSALGEIFSSIHLIVEVIPTKPPHSCAGSASAWEPCGEPAGRSGAAILRESLADFSVRLYHHLRLRRPTENLLFSPISISGMLTHLLLGARGATRQQLEEALCLPLNFTCVHAHMDGMRRALNGSLHLASQIYHNPDLVLSESFINQSLEFYASQPVPLLGDGLANAEEVNRWVAQNTQGLITHLVDTLHPDTQLVLLNAVAFKGLWQTRFDGGQTEMFTLFDGTTVSIPILYSSQRNASYKYISELKAQVMLFPLTEGTSLYILLPLSHTLADMQRLEAALSDHTLARMMQKVKDSEPDLIEVILPVIKLEIETDMDMLLRKLDLEDLLEGPPNLCGLQAEVPVVLDGARHRATLALTEDGVQAAGASVTLYARSNPMFSATRPFLLLLWSDIANAPLFMGRVARP